MAGRLVITLVLAIQSLCSLFFVGNIGASILGLTPISWSFREAIEIGAALGLILGSILGAIALRRSLARTALAEAQLQRASVAFMDMLDDRFAEWRLTPAERDVALFAIKGMSLQEIATLRQTSEGTVKAQTNAIYRKAGVSGRPQLLSLFIEELMESPMPARVAQADMLAVEQELRQSQG